MPMSPSRWLAVTQSSYRWEQEALNWLREHLPDHDPWRVWSNFEFIAEDGTVNEVDALVLSPAGLFLVEIKSRPGLVDGDVQGWTWTCDGRSYPGDNPLILAERKARRLGSLLRSQPSLSRLSRREQPRLEALIFLSARDLKCRLAGVARTRAHLRGQPGAIDDDGIIAALAGQGTRPALGGTLPLVSQSVGRAIGRAVDEAGIRPSRAQRCIGDYELGRLLHEGDGCQDWEARHARLDGVHRRIRIYPYAPGMAPEQRRILYRFAEREYRILETLDHQGILRVREFTESERGPALIFDHDPQARRLDLFLSQRGATLAIDQRLDLLRQIAEALRYAHDRRVVHRALSPESILVRDPEGRRPRLQIFNWRTAIRQAATDAAPTRGMSQTIDPWAFVEPSALVYLAPELVLEPERPSSRHDVFSLGAIAYHLFAGRPPAASRLELSDALAGSRGLRISDVIDGAGPELQALIAESTAARSTDRLASVDEFLTYLTAVEEELTAPEPERFADPLHALKGDRLEGGFTVHKRLGQGSTAVALQVRRDGDAEDTVLKVALEAAFDDRLLREAAALRRLRHPNIVQFFDPPLTIGGRTALLMTVAGRETLRELLDKSGRLTLDLLERFGEDLLSVVAVLEQDGIAHRDIKPTNMGVAELGRNGRLGLILFDFSLSSAPPEDIAAGTRSYLDPFLRLRQPPRWDLAAERFSVAVTLFEMAAGTLPSWGDGESDPAMVDVEATIDANRFDPSVGNDLAAFFRRALARDPKRRFDNAEEMVRAWRRVFDEARRLDAAAHAQGTFEAIVHHARPDTTIDELGFSASAQSVLESMAIHTVRELLAVNRVTFRYLRNVGDKVRKEIRLTAKELANRRPDLRPDRTSPVYSQEPEDANSIDLLVERLLPRRGLAEDSGDERALDLLLGLDAVDEDADPVWRSVGEAAATAAQSRAALANAVLKARLRWLDLPAFGRLRDDIAVMLEADAGVMAADEVALAVLTARGSEQPVARQRALAAAVARAAIEAESACPEPRFLLHLDDTRAIVARTEPLARYALALGDAADALAAGFPLPTPSAALERLRAIVMPDGLETITDRRLLRLAVAASKSAALSSRGEIHPIGMAAEMALSLAAGSLLGARLLTVAQIRDRVEGRYRRARPLPERPDLDLLLAAQGLDLIWCPDEAEGAGAYVPRGGRIGASTSGRPVTSPATDPTPAVIEAFETRLLHGLRSGGFLALMVPYRAAAAAVRALTQPHFATLHVSLDTLLIEAMQSEAAALGADWATVLRADSADRASLEWRRLLMLVHRCGTMVETRLMSLDRPALLTDAGLFGRYGLIGVLERLRDAAGRSGGPQALWLLLPFEGSVSAPVIDGVPVPVTGTAQWARVPETWLKRQFQPSPFSPPP